MLINKINDILNTTYTNDTYHTICKYIKDNISDIENMSIDKIAEECYVSKSMISKFTKKLGYETFKDFKYECETHSKLLKDLQPITSYTSYDLRANVIEEMDSITNALRNASNKIDYKKLNNLVNDINKAPYIVAIGHGASKNVCETMQFYLDYLKKSVIISDSDFTIEDSIDDNAIILIVSANGNMFQYNSRIINKINKLKQKKWLITCNSEIDNIENIVVVPSKNKEINDMLTMFITKVIVNILYNINKSC